MLRIRDDSSGRAALQIAVALGLSAYVLMAMRAAWLGDDAYITFRTIDNFINGYGLRWNVDERVQVFTHPLWLLLLVPFHFVTGEVYGTTLFVSLLVSAGAALIFALRIARSAEAAMVGLLVFLLSRAFIDYSTSGLENCLNHLLLAWFLSLYFRQRPTLRSLFHVGGIAGLLVLNRMDMLLICAPMLLWWYVRAVKREEAVSTRSGHRRPWIGGLGVVATAFLPFVAWELFSILYYGFPFPNTAYAKLSTGIESWRLAEQGLFYYFNTLMRDPLTLIVIFAGVAVPFATHRARHMAAAVAVVLYLVYIVRVGGDFMSGRFFTAPLFVAVSLWASTRLINRASLVPAAAVVAVLGFCAYYPTLKPTPLKPSKEEMVDVNGISDERVWYQQTNSLAFKSRDFRMPYWQSAADGYKYSRDGTRTVDAQAVGMLGYFAGPSVFVIDTMALTDPLLARLPALKHKGWRIGHFKRNIPVGYGDSVTSDVNCIRSADIAQYYEKVRIVTRAPVFDSRRLKEVWRFNLGFYDSLLERYPKRPLYSLAQTTAARVREEQTSATIMIPRGGIEITVTPPANAPVIRTALDSNDSYSIDFLLGGEKVGDIQIEARLFNTGLERWLLEVPARAVQNGYDMIVVKPVFGDQNYQMGYLELVDPPER